MRVLVSLVAAMFLLAPAKSDGYDVAMPANNLVQNPYFASLFSDWSGSWAALGSDYASAPNDSLCVAVDVYQDIPTTPGQWYSVSFYAAADIFYGPSVTVDLDINSQLLRSYVTPPNSNTGDIINEMQWQNDTATFEASGSTTQVEFADANTGDFGLTSVSVVPVPEPATGSLLAGGVIAGFILRSHRRMKARELK